MTPQEPTAEACAVVLVTAPDSDTGADIARAVVADELAACVNVVPGVRSIYRWEGAVQEEEEVLLVMKTRRARLGELTARVEAVHPYDVPEVVALPIEGGSAPYLAWVAAGAGGRP